MSEHTPGPWAANGPEEEIGEAVCSLGDGWCVVASEANPNEYEPEADARLIAAAPNMLEMLEEITFQIRRGQDISEWYSEIIDTIKKAKGGRG